MTLQDSLQALQDAINSGNQKKYDLALAGLTGSINGQQTLGFGDLMGILNGDLTLPAQHDIGSVFGQPSVDEQKLSGTVLGGGPSTAQEEVSGQLAPTYNTTFGPLSASQILQLSPAQKQLLVGWYDQLHGQGSGAASTSSGAMLEQQVQNVINNLATTQGAGQNAAAPTEAGRQFDLSTGENLLKTAAGLTGPQDYGDFLAETGGGKRLEQQIYGGRPSSSAPVGDMRPMDIYSLMGRLGMMPGQGQGQGQGEPGGGGTAPDAPDTTDYSQYPMVANPADLYYARGVASGKLPGVSAYDPTSYQYLAGATSQRPSWTDQEPGWFGDYMNRLISLGPDANAGAAQNLQLLRQLGLDNPQGLQTLQNPTGNVDPAYWDQLGPVGQSLLSQAAGKVFGWDQSSFLQQIDAERPVGRAYVPGSTGVQMAPLGSL